MPFTSSGHLVDLGSYANSCIVLKGRAEVLPAARELTARLENEALRDLDAKLKQETRILESLLPGEDIREQFKYLTYICRTSRELWPLLVCLTPVAGQASLERVLTSLEAACETAARAKDKLLGHVGRHPEKAAEYRAYIEEYWRHLERRRKSARQLLEGSVADIGYDLLKDGKVLITPPEEAAPPAREAREKCALFAETLANAAFVLGAVLREMDTEAGPPPDCFDDMSTLTRQGVALLETVSEHLAMPEIPVAENMRRQWQDRLKQWRRDVVDELKKLFTAETKGDRPVPPEEMKSYLRAKLLPFRTRTVELMEQARQDAALLDRYAPPEARGHWEQLFYHLVPPGNAPKEQYAEYWSKMLDHWDHASFREYEWWLDYIRKEGMPSSGMKPSARLDLPDAAALRLVHSLLGSDPVKAQREHGPLHRVLTEDSPALQRGAFQMAVSGALWHALLFPDFPATREQAAWILDIAREIMETPPGVTEARYHDFQSQCSLSASLTSLYILMPREGGPGMQDEDAPLRETLEALHDAIGQRGPDSAAAGAGFSMHAYFNQFLLDDLKPLMEKEPSRPRCLRVLLDLAAGDLCWPEHTPVLDWLQRHAAAH